MAKQEHEKLRQIAQKLHEFCYEFDYWEYMEYCEEQQESEFIEWDGMIDHLASEVEKDPTYFIEYLEAWEEEKADEIAQEIRAWMAEE